MRRSSELSVHLGRVQVAVGIALATLQTGGGCGGCPDRDDIVLLLPKANAPDADSQPIPPVGPLETERCPELCGVDEGGGTTISCESIRVAADVPAVLCRRKGACGGAGRRPPRMALRGGSFLARAAALEEASVEAFHVLHADLEAHGAPPALLRACGRAARDESRHARAVGALARRAGAIRCRVTIGERRAMTLAAMARHNASVGCVGEAWGALLAYVQAAEATDARVRRTMARIAEDEARHAALSLAIDAWLAPKLTPHERTRVGLTRKRHATRVIAGVARMVAVPELGLPAGPTARRLAESLFANLSI